MGDGQADMVRRACRAWCDGDISVYRDMYSADVVADGGNLWMEQGSVQGVDAVIDNFQTILRAFERSELIPTRLYEQDDKLVAALLWRGLLPGSDTPVEQPIASAYRFAGGLIAYQAWYSDVDAALAAIGISDSSGRAVELG
jgi:ketosteroid isomerase-like protein